MNKKYSTLIGCFFLLVGIAATSCGGEKKDMSERATQFMESMKEGDYEKTAKMWTDHDPEEALDDQQMWIINEIKKELEDEYGASIKSYQMGDDEGYKYFSKRDVTITLADGSEQHRALVIEKKLNGELGACSLKKDFKAEGLMAARGEVMQVRPIMFESADEAVSAYLENLKNGDVEALAGLYSQEDWNRRSFLDIVNAVDHFQTMNGGIENYQPFKNRARGTTAEYYFTIFFRDGSQALMFIRATKSESGTWNLTKLEMDDGRGMRF